MPFYTTRQLPGPVASASRSHLLVGRPRVPHRSTHLDTDTHRALEFQALWRSSQTWCAWEALEMLRPSSHPGTASAAGSTRTSLQAPHTATAREDFGPFNARALGRPRASAPPRWKELLKGSASARWQALEVPTSCTGLPHRTRLSPASTLLSAWKCYEMLLSRTSFMLWKASLAERSERPSSE